MLPCASTAGPRRWRADGDVPHAFGLVQAAYAAPSREQRKVTPASVLVKVKVPWTSWSCRWARW